MHVVPVRVAKFCISVMITKIVKLPTVETRRPLYYCLGNGNVCSAFTLFSTYLHQLKDDSIKILKLVFKLCIVCILYN